MRVAILTCGKLPNFVTWEIPKADELFGDDRLLLAALRERQIEAASVVWSEPGVDWGQFDLALIRSTWDYIDERDRFLAVLAEIDESPCRLFNPLAAVKWNSDKSYLFDLRDRDVPIVPTYVASAADPAVLQDTIVKQGWPSAVVKPRVGAGASEVRLVPSHDVALTIAALTKQRSRDELLVQPLIESVVSEGEWSFIYLDGSLSHVLLKKPAPGDYRAHGIYGGSIERAEPRRDDLSQVEAMLARIPYELLYARLDLVRIDGRLAIMELELIEPMLYFSLAPTGRRQMATAAVSKVRPKEH